jgi:hypothetical protein
MSKPNRESVSDMQKNGMSKKRTLKRSRTDRTIETVEALAINDASYRSRGRYLKSIDDLTLNRRWVDCVIGELVRAHNTELQDICAELSLRGLQQAALPPDLIELVTAEVRKISRSKGGDSGLGLKA